MYMYMFMYGYGYGYVSNMDMDMLLVLKPNTLLLLLHILLHILFTLNSFKKYAKKYGNMILALQSRSKSNTSYASCN